MKKKVLSVFLMLALAVFILPNVACATSYEFVITTGSASKMYDGTPLTCNEYTVEGSYLDFEITDVVMNGSIIDAGDVDNTVASYKIMDGTTDVTATYSDLVGINPGKLTVTKRNITLTSASADKDYDGTPLSDHLVTVTGDGFVGMDGFDYSNWGEMTHVGQINNEFKYTAKSGTNINNYNVECLYGTLTVNKRKVTLTSGSKTKYYDGTPLTDASEIVVGGDGFVSGEGVTTNIMGSQTEIGKSANEFDYTLNQSTNSADYNITRVCGTLIVLDSSKINEYKSEIVVNTKWDGKVNGDVVDVEGDDYFYGINAFSNLADAVDNSIKGTTIKLLSTVTLTDTLEIPDDIEITLDLNSNKIDATGKGTAILLKGSSKLIIDDTSDDKVGSIIATSDDANAYCIKIDEGDYASITIKNGKLRAESASKDKDYCYCYCIMNEGTGDITVDGGIFESIGTNDANAYNIWCEGDGSVVINDGKFKVEARECARAIAMSELASLTINGGSISAKSVKAFSFGVGAYGRNIITVNNSMKMDVSGVYGQSYPYYIWGGTLDISNMNNSDDLGKLYVIDGWINGDISKFDIFNSPIYSGNFTDKNVVKLINDDYVSVKPTDDNYPYRIIEKSYAYKITFDCQGYDDNPDTQYIEIAVPVRKVTEPDAPYAKGYSFLGWYNNGIKWYFIDNVTSNMKLEAKFSKNAPTTYVGSGDSNSKYTVSSNIITGNGAVEISTESAAKDSIVTVTIKPNKGYVLDVLKVNQKTGEDVEVTTKEAGKTYTFIMPKRNTVVTASFKEATNNFEDVSQDTYYYEPVNWAVENNITSGIDETHFGPKAITSRAQMVTFLWKLAGSPEPTIKECKFKDVANGSYYEKAVLWAVENRITSGTAETTFSPKANIKRGQAVTLIHNYKGNKATNSENKFSDVKENAYYYDSVIWAVENGITSGTTENTFSPNEDCTRAQVVTFLYNCSK